MMPAALRRDIAILKGRLFEKPVQKWNTNLYFFGKSSEKT